MDEPVRWVTKAEAAEELEISLSSLDRKIRKGEVEVVREGRRVYVRMQGSEYLSDAELLRRAALHLKSMLNQKSVVRRRLKEAKPGPSHGVSSGNLWAMQ